MRDILDLQAIPTLTAASGQEGIDQFTVHQDKIGLIILDLSMPGMSGIEAFAALRQVNPTAKIILSSGYTETEILEKMAGTRPTGFLQKPYRLDKVLSTVSQFLS
ncbi:MAG: response regulator [Anaerolineaceae bacterium]|nr:response regulator [Anaerolineaceae bacterium]